MPQAYDMLRSEYELGKLNIKAAEGGTGSRKFPRLDISIMVKRRPTYVLLNVALPTGIVSSPAVLLMRCRVATG